MKKTLVILAAVLMTAAVSYGQGQINFNNRVPGATDAAGNPAPIDAKVTLSGAAGAQVGLGAGQYAGGAWAQLAQVGTGGSLTLIGTPLAFRNNSAAAAFYVDPNT